MKLSYVMLPDYPLADAIETVRLADELGFHAAYSVDETWHKDPWILFAACARETRRIRLGPNLTPIGLRDPTLVAQALATLDELSGGRVECVFSIGDFGLLHQYGMDWTQMKPLSRVREAHHVMRTFLDEGAITFEGDFYRYSGLFTLARPVQRRLPLIVGAMRGPRSFELAGEIADGCHHAHSYSRAAHEYFVEHVRAGAERAGRDWRDLDLGAWCAIVCGPDPGEARRAAHAMVPFYLPGMPHEQLERHGVNPADTQPIVDALARGELDRAAELTSPDLADSLSIAGTPAECRARVEEIAASGINHVILCVLDPVIVKTITGRDVQVPHAREQLRLIAQHMLPALS